LRKYHAGVVYRIWGRKLRCQWIGVPDLLDPDIRQTADMNWECTRRLSGLPNSRKWLPLKRRLRVV
jgi:hypothetical protein